jgi:hypothetical protein
MKTRTLLLLTVICMLCTAGTFTCRGSTDDNHPRSAQSGPAGMR